MWEDHAPLFLFLSRTYPVDRMLSLGLPFPQMRWDGFGCPRKGFEPGGPFDAMNKAEMNSASTQVAQRKRIDQ